MTRLTLTFRYLLKPYAHLAAIAFISMLLAVAVSGLIFALTSRYHTPRPVVAVTSPADLTAALFALILGLVAFLINFQVALANGVTRKTFLLANLPAAALFAAALALFNALIVQVHSLFWPVIMTSSLWYPRAGLSGLLLYQVALYLALVVAGWLIALAYYRASILGRWAISFSPVFAWALVRLGNAASDGAVSAGLRDFYRAAMGLNSGSPAQAALSLLVFGAILYGLVYLVLRRTPLHT